MKKYEHKKLQLIVGQLSDVRIQDSEENFVSSGGAELTAGAAAVGLAAVGLAGAATDSLIAASGGSDSVQNFTALLDAQRISGRFSKIWFCDGDHVECVVDRQSDGTHAVYALRRPSDQTLWMFPHCSRGRAKHWLFAAKMSIALALLMTSFLLIILMFRVGVALWATKIGFLGSIIFTTMGVTMGFYFSIKTAFRWKPFVEIAESIFVVLGYPDPARVDLGQQDRLFRKSQSPRIKTDFDAPWVYRYPSNFRRIAS